MLWLISADVEISFSEADYRQSERSLDNVNDAIIPIVVTKSSRIASPIVIDIIPLTVDKARANNLALDHLPIPQPNPLSPPFAGKIKSSLYMH